MLMDAGLEFTLSACYGQNASKNAKQHLRATDSPLIFDASMPEQFAQFGQWPGVEYVFRA